MDGRLKKRSTVDRSYLLGLLSAIRSTNSGSFRHPPAQTSRGVILIWASQVTAGSNFPCLIFRFMSLCFTSGSITSIERVLGVEPFNFGDLWGVYSDISRFSDIVHDLRPF